MAILLKYEQALDKACLLVLDNQDGYVFTDSNLKVIVSQKGNVLVEILNGSRMFLNEIVTACNKRSDTQAVTIVTRDSLGASFVPRGRNAS